MNIGAIVDVHRDFKGRLRGRLKDPKGDAGRERSLYTLVQAYVKHDACPREPAAPSVRAAARLMRDRLSVLAILNGGFLAKRRAAKGR